MEGVKVDLPVRAIQTLAFAAARTKAQRHFKSYCITNHTLTPTRQFTWKTQDNVATAALFGVLAAMPGRPLTNAPQNLCFTSSERLYGDDWVLAGFDDYMLSRCPAPYGFDNPAGLYPNATAGRW